MTTSIGGKPQKRSLTRRWMGREFVVRTNILGSTVELHATHLSTGQRFISRADTWETAVQGLDELVIAYASQDSLSSLARLKWSELVNVLLQSSKRFLDRLRIERR